MYTMVFKYTLHLQDVKLRKMLNSLHAPIPTFQTEMTQTISGLSDILSKDEIKMLTSAYIEGLEGTSTKDYFIAKVEYVGITDCYKQED